MNCESGKCPATHQWRSLFKLPRATPKLLVCCLILFVNTTSVSLQSHLKCFNRRSYRDFHPTYSLFVMWLDPLTQFTCCSQFSSTCILSTAADDFSPLVIFFSPQQHNSSDRGVIALYYYICFILCSTFLILDRQHNLQPARIILSGQTRGRKSRRTDLAAAIPRM